MWGGNVADVGHLNEVSSPIGVFEDDVLGVDGGGDMQHLRIMLHILTLERGLYNVTYFDAGTGFV